MIDRGQFLYTDNSNKLFTKIQLVNTLTQKEIDKLNMKYKELGLFIKQISVDHLGNEIASNELLLETVIIENLRGTLTSTQNIIITATIISLVKKIIKAIKIKTKINKKRKN